MLEGEDKVAIKFGFTVGRLAGDVTYFDVVACMVLE